MYRCVLKENVQGFSCGLPIFVRKSNVASSFSGCDVQRSLSCNYKGSTPILQHKIDPGMMWQSGFGWIQFWSREKVTQAFGGSFLGVCCCLGAITVATVCDCFIPIVGSWVCFFCLFFLLEPIPAVSGRGQDTPWTNRQLITGPFTDGTDGSQWPALKKINKSSNKILNLISVIYWIKWSAKQRANADT